MEKFEELSDDHHRNDERRLPPSSPRAPWLITRHGDKCKFQTLYNISENPFTRSHEIFIPELSAKMFWQKNSHQGWLIVISCDEEDPKFNHREIFLWNPASPETLNLPREPLDRHGYSIEDCVLSSPPQMSRSSSDVDYDSMVFILYNGGGEYSNVLIYCHPGEKHWRKHEFVGVYALKSLFYFKGKLFIICTGYSFYMEAEIQQDAETLSISDAIDFTGYFQPEQVIGGIGGQLQFYFVESFGEVFQICRHYYPRGNCDNCILVSKMKMDFSSMIWEEVKSMDDYVLFLSENTQLSCLASDLGLSKGNCVYFTQAEEMSLYKYDLEDNSILLITLPSCPNLSQTWYRPEWLMVSATPRFDDSIKTTDHELGKEECRRKIIRVTDNRIVDKEAGPWIMLNDDHMVWLLSNYPHLLDYIHLRGVSKKHWTMLELRRSSSTRTTTDLSPWLVFHKHHAVYSFINPMHDNENYVMNIPDLLKGFRIRFSKGGWLLFAKGKTLYFYNPFTKSTVKLPDLPYLYHHSVFAGISFSSLPSSSDCVVFGIGKRFSGVEIIFIKRGDESWTHSVFDDNIYLSPIRVNVNFQLHFNNSVFWRGSFYCLDLNGTLGLFKLGPDISWEILPMVAPPNCELIYESYLVECDGNLMSVLLGHLGKWVRIFRLNDAEMVWVEVQHLGRHMLCISNTCCVSAMAPNSRMENKIYFPRLHNEGILYYSLDTGMYHSFGSNHCAEHYRDSKENLHCSWIEPNWSEISDYYRDWLNI